MSEHGNELSRRSVLKHSALATGSVVLGGVAASGTAAAGIGDGRVLDFHLNNVNYDRDKGDIVAGHVHDASPAQNDGEWWNPEVDPVVKGAVGNAFQFDGSDSYIDVPDDATLDLVGESLTLAAWFNTQSTGRGGLIRKNDQDGWGPAYDLEVNRAIGKVDFLLRPPKTIVRSSIDGLNDGQWHHAAGSYDSESEKMKLYIDGQLDTKKTVDISDKDTTGAVQIGRMAQATTSTTNRSVGYMDGLIDEVRIYNRALSSDEVTELYEMKD